MATTRNPLTTLPTVLEDVVSEKMHSNECKCRNGFKKTINGFSNSEMDLEIEALRKKLKNAHFALAQTQTQMELHRIRTRQIIMAWKLRIHEADDKVRRQRQERDLELKEITAQLLFFEGQLKKEQTDIKTMLKGKDTIIMNQLKKIGELEATNDRLHRELSDIKKRLPNGLHVSFSDEEPKNVGSSRDDSIVDDAFMQMPCSVGSKGQMSYSMNRETHHNKTSNSRKKTKSRNNSPFYRSISLPNCIDSSELVDGTVNESSEIDTSINRETKFENISDSNSNYISSSSSRVRGRRERTFSGSHNNLTNNNNDLNKNHHMAYSQPNLNSSTASTDSLLSSRSNMDISMDSSVTSLENGNPARTRSLSCDLVNVIEKKSESPRDRIKRAFLRPRDVKKKSKMRLRSNSLKENDPDIKNKLSPTKRYFSFAF